MSRTSKFGRWLKLVLVILVVPGAAAYGLALLHPLASLVVIVPVATLTVVMWALTKMSAVSGGNSIGGVSGVLTSLLPVLSAIIGGYLGSAVHS